MSSEHNSARSELLLRKVKKIEILKRSCFFRLQVDQGSPAYPRSTAEWWFDCKELNKGYLRAANDSSSSSSSSGGISQMHQGEKSRRDVDKVTDHIGKVADVQSGALEEGNHRLHEQALVQSAAAATSATSSALNFALVISALIVMFVAV